MKSQIAITFFCIIALVSVHVNATNANNKAAHMARWVMNEVDWVSVSSISTMADIEGYPMGNVKSTSDGPAGNSTGIPYFFTTDKDLSCKDYLVNNQATVFASMASTNFCRENNYDAQDPRCPRLILTGTYQKVDDENERSIAMKGLLEKHPEMEVWMELPDFYVGKLEIKKVIFLGTYGPSTHISVDDYFAVQLTA